MSRTTQEQRLSGFALRKTSLCLTIGFIVAGLSACAVKPEPVSLDQQLAQASADRSKMFDQQEPLNRPVSLNEAMARAVKYNLQQRVGLMEQAMEEGLLETQNLSMLPQLAARAGWRGRDNVAGSSSESVRTRTQSLEPSTSSDRSGHTADLQLSWNVLDFGISYFGAKVQANKSLAAEERRRRVIADIIQQVRTAYWDAATAQRLKPQVQSTLVQARAALDQARVTERERLLTPIDSLRYQKSLVEMIRQLEVLDGELALSKARLAGLMNIPPASQYSLAVPDDASMTPPSVAYSLDDLETLAMTQRPEIREETYQARNAVLETRMAMLKLLPGVNLFAGLNRDSNSYLVNEQWADAGMQISWNLMSVLSYSSIKKTGETREAVAELRRQAVRMAVLTQVNVAWQQYQRANRLFERSNELQRLQDGILAQSESAYSSQAQSLLEKVRIETETVLAKRTRDRSFAELQATYGAIQQAAGLDPLPQRLAGESIAELTQAIARNAVDLARGQVQIPRFETPLNSVAQNRPAPASPVAIAPIARVDMFDSLGSLQGVELKEQGSTANAR